jgi:pyridoxamine 5'-phosphate oxidase-like protein
MMSAFAQTNAATEDPAWSARPWAGSGTGPVRRAAPGDEFTFRHPSLPVDGSVPGRRSTGRGHHWRGRREVAEPDREPVSAEPMIAGATASTPWAWVQAHLEKATATYWLATVRADGTPHVTPVLAVWVDGGLFFCTGERTRKARNLARDSRCLLTVEVAPLESSSRARRPRCEMNERFGAWPTRMPPSMTGGSPCARGWAPA